MDALDAGAEALPSAESSENQVLLARINAKLGYIYYKCLFKDDSNRIATLKQAAQYYSVMLQASAALNQDGELIEPWFINGKQEDLELKSELARLETGQQDDATKAAHEANAAEYEAMKRMYAEDKSEFKVDFIQFIII